MKRMSLVIFLVIMLLTTVSIFSAENSQVATVSSLKGSVSVQHNGKTWDKASENMPLYLNDALKTEKGSYADVKFAIGGQVGVNENTTIQITGSRQVNNVGQETFIQKVIINAGEIWAKITKQQQEMQFETKGGVIAIKGTEFVVEVNPDTQDTVISLMEGKISFLGLNNLETLFEPGDQATVSLVNKIGELNLEKFDPAELRSNLGNKFQYLNKFINLDPNSIINGLPVDPNNLIINYPTPNTYYPTPNTYYPTPNTNQNNFPF